MSTDGKLYLYKLRAEQSHRCTELWQQTSRQRYKCQDLWNKGNKNAEAFKCEEIVKQLEAAEKKAWDEYHETNQKIR